MSEVDSKFWQLEIFPGVGLPLTYDARNCIAAAVVKGDSEGAKQIVTDLFNSDLVDYMRDLLDLPADASDEQVWLTLWAKRATAFGLPAATPSPEVADLERRYNRCLTLGELRRERDQRLGTYRPLVNGEW
jgi:hypothetical protein